MKKIIIGTLVGAIIYFTYQSLMWAASLHKDFLTYSAEQDKALQTMKDVNLKDGMYILPNPNPTGTMTHKESHELMMKNVGKPWATVFYHSTMKGEDMSVIFMGFIHALIVVLLSALVIYYGGFGSFGSRFLTGFSFGLFSIVMGPMNELNWWQFPWSFVQPQVVDLTLGWGICSIWLAWFVKKPASK